MEGSRERMDFVMSERKSKRKKKKTLDGYNLDLNTFFCEFVSSRNSGLLNKVGYRVCLKCLNRCFRTSVCQRV